MARSSRRAFITVAGAAVGVVVVSKSVAELFPRGSDTSTAVVVPKSVAEPVPLGSDPSTVLERLAVPDRSVGDDLLELGHAINEQSPMSAQRAGELALAEPDGSFAEALVDAGRPEPRQPTVVIDGWLLPDLFAGVAGAAALESEQQR